MRDSFVFYKSFYEAIRYQPRDIQGEIYTAIMEYSLYGRETENLKPIARSIFALIQPLIDANIRKRGNGKKGAEYGKLGGRPSAEENPENSCSNDIVELIYNSYPTRCVVGGRSTGKSGKCKDKIKTLLKSTSSEQLIDTIKWYIEDCKKTNTYMKNFSTFLNNIPDISEDNSLLTKEKICEWSCEQIGLLRKGTYEQYESDVKRNHPLVVNFLGYVE